MTGIVPGAKELKGCLSKALVYEEIAHPALCHPWNSETSLVCVAELCFKTKQIKFCLTVQTVQIASYGKESQRNCLIFES